MVLDHFTAPIITTIEPTQSAPAPGSGNKAKARDKNTKPDPNIPDHRLNINRPCIYERRLPDNAYITAHVQRLQHGHYSTAAVSDRDIEHVDFLAISFVFHSPDTLNHRFKAATIRVSLHYPSPSYSRTNGNKHERLSSSSSSSSRSHRSIRTHPHFLMHAPHFLHGAVSPETLQWNYSLAGSLGVAQLPFIASLSPAAGLNGRFNRYEMLRVQGSVRTYHGAPASQIVWTLEENTLQRSGLPREFTFAMLVARPGPIHERRIELRVEIEPVLQSWIWGGAYPSWLLRLLRRYRASRKRGVDFRGSVGQRFGSGPRTGTGSGSGQRGASSGPAELPGSSVSRRGFNFATLVNSFDEYVSWQGKKVEPTTGTNLHGQTDLYAPVNPLPVPNPPAPAPAIPWPFPYPYPYPHVQTQGQGQSQAPSHGQGQGQGHAQATAHDGVSISEGLWPWPSSRHPNQSRSQSARDRGDVHAAVHSTDVNAHAPAHAHPNSALDPHVPGRTSSLRERERHSQSQSQSRSSHQRSRSRSRRTAYS
ncbi:hypothetical protein BDV06DRAFT_194534 [Aspergillus oleicola]